MSAQADHDNVCIRDATQADVAALGAIHYGPAVHRDRVRDADGKVLRYLVVVRASRVVGHGALVLAQPPTWPKMARLPQMNDLHIRADLRSHGLGTRLIQAMEDLAREAGCAELFMGVDPAINPRATALYRRLGYEPADREPVEDRWEFTDSDGVVHQEIEQIIHMRKPLS